MPADKKTIDAIHTLVNTWKETACDKAKSNEVPYEVWHSFLKVWKIWTDAGGASGSTYIFDNADNYVAFVDSLKKCREMSKNGYKDKNGDSYYNDRHTEVLKIMESIEELTKDKKTTTAPKKSTESSKESGMPKSTFVEGLKSNASEAAMRTVGKRATKKVSDFLAEKIAQSDKSMTKAQKSKMQEYLGKFFETPWGRLMVGMLLKEILPKAAGLVGKADHPMVQKLASECEIGAMSDCFDEVADVIESAAGMLKGMLGEAIDSMPSMAVTTEAEATT